jgi:hypothetical protein
MTRTRTLLVSMIALACAAASAAAADSYPVSGRWTYNDALGSGPAPECRKPTMEFRGAQRLDSVGGVPAFRNVRVDQSSTTTYRVVDEFFNVMIRGRVSYTLRIRDKDHLQIDYDRGGKSVTLRRCA